MAHLRPRPFARLLFVATALVVVGAGCTSGGGAGGGEPSAPTSSGATVSSSFSPPATPNDPYTQDFTNGVPCAESPAPGLPPRSGCVSAAVGDLDGDRLPDRFVVFAALGDGGMPASWKATALLGNGFEVPAVAIPTGAAVEGQSDLYPRVVGTFDADHDGRDEVFVKLTGIVYHIAVSHIAGIFDLVNGSIRQVALKGDGPWHFFTGGTSRRGQGVVCATAHGRPVLLVRLIQVVPPERWAWTESAYRWANGHLERGAVRRGFYPQSVSIADPRVTAFYALRCGSVFLE